MRAITFTFYTLFAVIAFTTVTACSSSGNGSAPEQPKSSENQGSNEGSTSDGAGDDGELSGETSWTLGSSKYTTEQNVENTTQISNLGTIVTVLSSTASTLENEGYEGSDITITATDTGAGIYSLASSLAAIRQVQQSSPTASVAYVEILAGKNRENKSIWRSVASGLLVVRVDDDGAYSYSTDQPYAFFRKEDIGTGIPESPDNIIVSFENIVGVQQ